MPGPIQPGPDTWGPWVPRPGQGLPLTPLEELSGPRRPPIGPPEPFVGPPAPPLGSPQNPVPLQGAARRDPVTGRFIRGGSPIPTPPHALPGSPIPDVQPPPAPPVGGPPSQAMPPGTWTQGPRVPSATVNSNPMIPPSVPETPFGRLRRYAGAGSSLRNTLLLYAVLEGNPPDPVPVAGDAPLAAGLTLTAFKFGGPGGLVSLGLVAGARGIIANMELARLGTVIPADPEVLDMIKRMEKVASHQIGPLDFTDP